MARPIWKGSLSFGLVNVPVGLYAATQRHEVTFHQFEAGTSDRIRYKRVNETTGEEVAYERIVKGAVLDDGRYAILTSADLRSIEPVKSRTIDIHDFVSAADIDPILYQKSYYLGPSNDSATKAYGLLVAAMEQAERVAVATFVMREKQYLAAVRPRNGVLVVETLFYPDEVRDPIVEVERLPIEAEPKSQDLEVALNLIDAMTTQWEPTQYRDEYQEKVQQLVEAKVADEKIITHAPITEPDDGKVVDLFTALQRSLERTKKITPTPQPMPTQSDPMTKAELYAAARRLDIPGRSKMTAAELRHAVQAAS